MVAGAGDVNWNEAGKHGADRTQGVVSEFTASDNDTDNHTLTHDAAGNLIDDGEDYEYVYDPFGRLRFVKRTDGDLPTAARHTLRSSSRYPIASAMWACVIASAPSRSASVRETRRILS